MLRRLTPMAAAAAVLGGTLVLAPSATAQPLENPQPGVLTPADAYRALGNLEVDEDGAAGDYSRSEFYGSWRVVTAQPGDGDAGLLRWYGWDAYAAESGAFFQPTVADALGPQRGCDAREITLIRDAIEVEWDASDCSIISGTWYEDYAASTTTDPGDLDIEHIVAMQDAWNTGASTWTPQQRLQFSHDPLVLAAVSDTENQAKGASHPELVVGADGEVVLDDNGDPVVASGAWLPSNPDSWGGYALRYVSIKTNYDLDLQNEASRATLKYMLEQGYTPQELGIEDAEEPTEPEVPEEPTDPVEPEPTDPVEPEPEVPVTPEDPADPVSPPVGPEPGTPADPETDDIEAPAKPGGPAVVDEEIPLYENCDDARDQGAAPVHRGEPGYGPHLDRDSDGVGCEDDSPSAPSDYAPAGTDGAAPEAYTTDSHISQVPSSPALAATGAGVTGMIAALAASLATGLGLRARYVRHGR